MDKDVGMKILENVNTRQDIHSWLRLGFFPQFQDSFLDAGQDVVEVEEKRQWDYNVAVGGVRVLQERSEPTDCPHKELASRLAHFDVCYPASFIGGGYLIPAMDQLVTEDRTDSSKVEWYLYSEGWNSTIERLDRDIGPGSAWLDKRVVHTLQVAAPLYNPELNVLGIVYAEFFFARSGLQWTRILAPSLTLDTYSHWGQVIADVIVVLMLAHLAVIEVQEIRDSRKEHGGLVRGFRQHIRNRWNLVDFVSILGGAAMYLVWYLQWQRIASVREELLSSPFESRLLKGDHDEQIQAVGGLMAALESAIEGSLSTRAWRVVYIIIITMRVFKAFHAQARLSVLTQTLSQAVVDVAHLMCIFAVVVAGYCISGMMLFGHALEDFATLDRVANKCWRIILGDFDYPELRDASGHLTSAMWLSTFCLVNAVVLFNMLLAIIMDCYTQVKGSVGSSAETLTQQASETFRRWHGARQGLRLPVQTVLQSLLDCKLDPSERLTIEGFCHHVHGLPKDQAGRLLTGALLDSDDAARMSQSLAAAIGLIGNVDARVRAIHRCLNTLVKVKSAVMGRDMGVEKELLRVSGNEQLSQSVLSAFDLDVKRQLQEPTPEPQAEYATSVVAELQADMRTMKQDVHEIKASIQQLMAAVVPNRPLSTTPRTFRTHTGGQKVAPKTVGPCCL